MTPRTPIDRWSPSPVRALVAAAILFASFLAATSVSSQNDTAVQWYKEPGVIELPVTGDAASISFDEVLYNQTDPGGLGAFAFTLVYDAAVWEAPTIDLGPAVELFAASGRTLSCEFRYPGTGMVHVVCPSTGTIGVGPTWSGGRVLARVTAQLKPDYVAALMASPLSETTSVFHDTDVDLANTCGQPLNDGTGQGLPGQTNECQGRLLPGLAPGGEVERPGDTTVIIRPVRTPTPTASPTRTPTAAPTTTPTPATTPTPTPTVPPSPEPTLTPTSPPGTTVPTVVTLVTPTPAPPTPTPVVGVLPATPSPFFPAVPVSGASPRIGRTGRSLPLPLLLAGGGALLAAAMLRRRSA